MKYLIYKLLWTLTAAIFAYVSQDKVTSYPFNCLVYCSVMETEPRQAERNGKSELSSVSVAQSTKAFRSCMLFVCLKFSCWRTNACMFSLSLHPIGNDETRKMIPILSTMAAWYIWITKTMFVEHSCQGKVFVSRMFGNIRNAHKLVVAFLFYASKFYARTHVKITRQWTSTLTATHVTTSPKTYSKPTSYF